MEDRDWWPYGKPPIAGSVERVPLSIRAVAEALEYRDLFNRHQEQLRAEGKGDLEVEFRTQITLDFSGMSDKRREAVEAEIAELRADPEVRAGLRRRLENTQPELARFMDGEGPTAP